MLNGFDGRVKVKTGNTCSSNFQSLPALLSGKELMDQMSNMMDTGSNSLESLVKSGKYQDVGRIVGSISSILNYQVKQSGEEKSSSLKEERKQVQYNLIILL